VIPQVVQVVTSRRCGTERRVAPPARCPSCRGPVAKQAEEDVALRCLNASCPAQVARTLLHFGSREAMDIEGLGEAVVEQLLARRLVRDVADLYRLRVEDLLPLELFAQRKAEKLIQAIAASKGRGLARLLYGLGVRHIGEKAALVLAEQFGSLRKLQEADTVALEAIYEVGPVMAKTLRAFLELPSTRALLKKLEAAGVKMTEEAAAGPKPLAGQSIVFTGELSQWSRTQAEALVRRLGGSPSSSVSRRTAYVVAGEAPGSKLAKAKALGVRVISEAQFRQLVGGAA
jgi:DNA ligase (NAD+)